MAESSGYGNSFGERLQARATLLVSRTLQNTMAAVTEVRSDNPRPALSSSLVREDAFLIALQLRDYPLHEYWEDGRAAPITALGAGQTTIYHLERDPVFNINNPFHSVHFYFSRAALNDIADTAHAPRIGELRYSPGAGIDDRTTCGLAWALLPALERPDQANRLFVDHVTLALGAHAASTYGAMKTEPVVPGGLAPWQEKRATEMIDANLSGDISPVALARACGLSVSYFARAFRKSKGMPPHRWLLERRVERAKQAMRSTDASLTEVALSCGFADQSHFTRVFGKIARVSPGAWRRQTVGCRPAPGDSAFRQSA